MIGFIISALTRFAGIAIVPTVPISAPAFVMCAADPLS